MPFRLIRYEVEDGVCTVTLNRPKVNNAYNGDLIAGLHEAMDALGKIDPTQAETISVPHMAELFEAIMTAFQGTQGFARHVMHTFLSAKPGSAVKQKILSDIIKLGQKTTETGLAQVSMDKLTTEELDELHKRIAGQIVSERKLAKKASVPVIQEMLDGLEDRKSVV